MAFATAAEFADRIGLTLSDDEQTRATNLLGRVSDMIKDVADQQIEQVSDDVLTLSGTTDSRILLPERPVVSVASVKIDGAELAEGSEWFLDGDEVVRRTSTIVSVQMLETETLSFGQGYEWLGFGYEWQTLEITYTHGYAADEIPPFLKEICCEAVVRVWVNPGSVARQSVAGTSTVYDNMRFSPTGLLLTADEKRTIRRFFGLKGGSVPMKD